MFIQDLTPKTWIAHNLIMTYDYDDYSNLNVETIHIT